MAEQRILVTGSVGRIGRTLMRHWSASKPIGLDCASADRIVDLTDVADPGVFEGVDTVVHLAAYPDGNGSFATAARANLEMTLAVLDGCMRAGVRRLIYASSVWADARAWRRSDRATWYGASKIAGEALVEAWADQTGHPAVCLRIGWFSLNGAAPDPATAAAFVDEAMLCWHFDEALAFAGPGSVVRYAIGRQL